MHFRENDVRLYDGSEKWHSAKWRFEKKTFGKMTIRENDLRLNYVSRNWRSAKYRFEKNDIRHYIVSVISLFGNMKIRPTDIRRHDESVKWLFGKMMWPPINSTPKNVHWVKTLQMLKLVRQSAVLNEKSTLKTRHAEKSTQKTLHQKLKCWVFGVFGFESYDVQHIFYLYFRYWHLDINHGLTEL